MKILVEGGPPAAALLANVVFGSVVRMIAEPSVKDPSYYLVASNDDGHKVLVSLRSGIITGPHDSGFKAIVVSATLHVHGDEV